MPPGGPPGPGAAGWSPTEAIGFGWNALTKNFAGTGLAIGVAFVVMVLPSLVINFGSGIVMGLLSSSIDPDVLALMNFIPSIIGSVVNLVMQAYIMGGVVETALKTARGETTTFANVFGGGKYFGAFLVGGILNSIAVTIGLVLCIVPGVIVGLGLSMYTFLIVDRRLSAVDALKASWELTKGHKMTLFLYALLCIPVVIAGYLACLIGALLASAPIIVLGSAYIYLKLQGEHPRLPAGA